MTLVALRNLLTAWSSRPGHTALMIAVTLVCAACAAPVERTLEAQRNAEAQKSANVKFGGHTIDPQFGQIDAARRRLAEIAPVTPAPASAPTPRIKSSLDALPQDATPVTVQLRDVTLRQVAWILSKDFGVMLPLDDAARALKTRADVVVKSKPLRDTIETILATFDVAALPTGSGSNLLLSPQISQTYQLDPNQYRSSFSAVTGGDLLGASKDAPLKHQKQTADQFGNAGDPLDSLVKAVESMIAEDEDSLKSTGRTKPGVSLDKVRGVLVVTCRPSRMGAVARLIEEQATTANQQIDIDAQIIELEVSDGLQAGIDWSLLGADMAAVLGASQVRVPSVSADLGGSLRIPALEFAALTAGRIVQGSTSGGGGLVYGRNGVVAAVNALRSYGDVRVLASPTVRLRSGTMSNLSVGDVIRYVESIKTTITQGGTATEVNTESLFSGLNFSVGARLSERGTIDLLVAPTQNIVDEASLAMVDIGSAGKLTLPRVRTKSISNWLNVQSGSIVIIGGLLDRQHTGSSTGVPGLSELPDPLAPTFGKKASASRTKELLLVLRAEALPS